ncbi:MAG TPA: FG-GAP-like repeat-containing protein [Candidatus Sulfotelmatobacter sp.]|nr:FG-GAP-like repeat-containing protein [Candidatus Sulfotelmatobacter sp.]
MRWAPVLFLPAPFKDGVLNTRLGETYAARVPHFPFADARFMPQYPEKSPLDEIIRLATPGTDEYVLEGYASQLMNLLHEWSQSFRTDARGLAAVEKVLAASMQASSLNPVRETRVRSGNGIEVLRREFDSGALVGRERWLGEFKQYLAPLRRVETADFEIYECTQSALSPLTLEAGIRYEIVGEKENGSRESRQGSWRTQWACNESGAWRLLKWTAQPETVSRTSGRLFVDVTSAALRRNDSYINQLLHGADYWRTILDGAIGVDVYGNNGIAAGDFNNDGLDDLYVCQPAGLPNRLYRNRGDGTFEDVTEASGVGVVDFSACALFADFENRGVQDLLVVCATGPLLFINDGRGKFSLKKDAFAFARPPQGSFTHCALADYDRDGRLDVYFCLYNYYGGLDQYRYPVPYFDARNGPPNYLFHNAGGGTFEDRTEAAGLNLENDRYSFACSWGDSNGDGWPDLYVVNDFGRNVLYRNKADGTFAAVSSEARVDEAGAGMSACWLDFDNDGKQDLYAAGMWVAAGMRIFEDRHFHPGEPAQIRALYRRHMTGNSLYRNQADGTFENVAPRAGVEMGRWSWSSDAWDFDHDGYPDLYVANGYVSGLEPQKDVSSFFWRQVVANSPSDSIPSSNYERGWGAINELIRSDSAWNGFERNVFFANNRDGTFSDISGVAGLDFRDDSRAFALADLDGDGRIEIVLKNRNAPQLRILRNAMQHLGNSITFRLRGDKSNRDGVGAAVSVVKGSLRQTKYVQAGSGFLSQHTKDLHFGLGENLEAVNATIRWPSGLTQDFENLPLNHRIHIREGAGEFQAQPFASSPEMWAHASDLPAGEEVPASWATWLIEPVSAPEFALSDMTGKVRELSSFRGRFVLLALWVTTSAACRDQLRALRKADARFHLHGVQTVAVNFDDPPDPRALQSFTAKEALPFPTLIANAGMAGLYNLVYRYMFDRHRELSFPISFLIDKSGDIVKVYQGSFDPESIPQDVASVPGNAADRTRKALPFPGTLFQDEFQRNALTYGVAFLQHGYLDQAERAFQQVIANKPDQVDAYYNLGTLYLRRNAPQPAKDNLEKAVTLRPNYPEAWNNLGMLAAQAGNNEEAVRNFQRSLELRPSYSTALLNLGNLYRRQGNFVQAESLLGRAYASDPDNPEINYSLGMLYARRSDARQAEKYLRNAIKLRPDYADAMNNLGVLFIQQQRYPDAESQLEECMQRAPEFDQAYLNLARLYLVLNDKEKARAVLQTLLQKQPEHKMARQMLQLLY